MNIDKLKVGVRIKSYNKLCELIGFKAAKGKTKLKQIQEFKRYFDWDVNGFEIIITKIHKKPKVFTENEMLEMLILHQILNNSNNTYTILESKLMLFERFEMVNRYYRYLRKHKKVVSYTKNIEIEIVEDFCKLTDSTLANRLKSILRKLADKKIIMYHDTYMIAPIDAKKEIISTELSDIELDYLNQWYKEQDILSREQLGKKYEENPPSIHREATDKEKKFVLKIEKDALKKLNKSSYYDVMMSGDIEEYEKIINYQFERNNILCFYKAIKIIFLEDEVSSELDKFITKYTLSTRNRSDYGKFVNKDICSKLIQNGENRHDSICKKDEEYHNQNENTESLPDWFMDTFGQYLENNVIYEEDEDIQNDTKSIVPPSHRSVLAGLKANEDYTDKITKLVNLFINIKAKNIVDELQKEYKDKKLKENSEEEKQKFLSQV